MEFFLCVLGLAMVLEGMPYFLFPSQVKELMRELLEQPSSLLRGIGFLLMLSGLFFVFLGTR